MKRIASLIFAALVLTGLSAAPALAKDDKVPTKITSDRMVYEAGGSQVTFLGNVHVTRPDMQIWSEKMVVYLKKTAKTDTAKKDAAKKDTAVPLGGDPGEVDKIVALKKVRMLREGKEGFCGKATFLVQEDLLVMEEFPRLVDGKNTIQGKVIRLYLKEDRSEVEGAGNTQVEAIFFTPKDAAKPADGDKPATDAQSAPEAKAAPEGQPAPDAASPETPSSDGKAQ